MKEMIAKLGIELNQMQQATADSILNTDKDIVVLSPTGSGKTFAYLLPIMKKIEVEQDYPQAVVLLPSRELAQQATYIVKEMKTPIRAEALYGGRPTMDEHRILNQQKPHIIFATPGRLNDHIEKSNFPIHNIHWLVIDEFDKCLEMGFQKEMETALESLPNVDRRILLSATESTNIPRFVRLNRVKVLDYRTEKNAVKERIELFSVQSDSKDKLETVAMLLQCLGNQKSMVFLNYRDAVLRVASYLSEKGFGVSFYHGGLEQKEREAALYRFMNGSSNIFVCTNLGSRGLDIPDVENIIHYHFAETKEEHIHRIGRTARWDKTGQSFFIVAPTETIPDYVEDEVNDFLYPDNLPNIMPPQMATLYIGKGKMDKISKADIVGYLCKKGGLKAADIGRIDVMPRFTYVAVTRRKVAQVIKQTKNEKIKGLKTIVEEIR